MKTKRFALVLACIISTTVVLLLYGDPSVQPSIQNLVSETHTRFSNWKTFQEIKDAVHEPEPEEKYLRRLGFHIDKPRLYPKYKTSNLSIPVFTTILSPANSDLFPGFFKSFQHFFSNYSLIVYELGLHPADYLLVNSLCNVSNCILRTFDFDSYPPHIHNLHLYAFRPIIIQEVLNEAGAVIVMDIEFVFVTADISTLVAKAEKEGIISWTVNQPTSALTHPRLFDYFNIKQEKFFFHRMVQPNQMILYNINSIHFGVMFPWVKCALVSNCIAPIGAQDSGCRFDKKPLYRYSGCHRYDASALNVVLGLMFDFSSSHYAAKEEDKFFRLGYDVTESADKNATTFLDSV